MNELSATKRGELKRLLMLGNSVRAIAAAIGCSKVTVSRYRVMWEVAANCGCGRPSGHNGWCHVRLAFSPKRDAWLMDRWKTRQYVYEPIRLGIDKAQSLGHTIGPFVWASFASGSVAFAACVVCGKSIRIYGGHGYSEGYQDSQRFDGTAVKGACKTAEQLELERQQRHKQREDKRAWQLAKRTLRETRTYLRQPNSRTTASPPEPTSPA